MIFIRSSTCQLAELSFPRRYSIFLKRLELDLERINFLTNKSSFPLAATELWMLLINSWIYKIFTWWRGDRCSSRSSSSCCCCHRSRCCRCWYSWIRNAETAIRSTIQVEADIKNGALSISSTY